MIRRKNKTIFKNKYLNFYFLYFFYDFKWQLFLSFVDETTQKFEFFHFFMWNLTGLNMKKETTVRASTFSESNHALSFRPNIFGLSKERFGSEKCSVREKVDVHTVVLLIDIHYFISLYCIDRVFAYSILYWCDCYGILRNLTLYSVV
jgi:hypothetical protein